MADNRKYAQLQNFQLAGSGAVIGATSIVLSSFQDIDGNNLLITDFGTKGYATIEPSNGSQEESIAFTGVTQNANGTATLTGVSNVAFLYPYTETSGLAKTHAGGTTLIITNTSAFYNGFTNKFDDETIVATWGFTLVPNTEQDPVAGNDLARRSWVLDQINGGPVSTDSVIISGAAGETLAAGDLVYLKTADGYWWKTDADTAATVNGVEIGTAQGAGTATNNITGGVLLRGIDPTNTGLTPGATYYASNTAGDISSSPGTINRAIGVANSAGSLILDPYFVNIPTTTEKTAITSLAQAILPYATDAQATDTYVITLSPAPTAYTIGMEINFKAATINTGAATLNVNGLGAKTIVKNINSALVDGDIRATQIVKVIYDGTNFVLQGTKSHSSGFFSRASDVADGTVTAAHGLGIIPRYMKVEARMVTSSTAVANHSISTGTYDGTTTSTIYTYSGVGTAGVAGNTNTNIINIRDIGQNFGQEAVGTFDATNLSFAFTKIGANSTGTLEVFWEAFV